MKLKLLLWYIGRLFNKACHNNEQFRQLLDDKDLTFQLQTENGKIARHYMVKNNRIKSQAGNYNDSDLKIKFADAQYALGVLLSKDKNAFMKGIQDKKITVQGDLALLMWLQSIMKHLR